MDLPALPSRVARALVASAFVALIAAPAGCGGGATDAEAAPKTAPTVDEPPEAKTDDTTTIDIYCNPPTKALVDGKPAGTTPVTGFKVKPGSHDVTFADEMTGNRTMTVVLEAGENKAVTSDRPPSATQKPDKPEKPSKGK